MLRITTFIAALVLFVGSAQAQIAVNDAKARATFVMAQSGAAYMTLTNQGDKADTLTSVSVDPAVAAMVEIHTVTMDDGMMRMRELEDGVTLAPGEKTLLAPGGKHIMLMGLSGPLEAGKEISLTLHFAHGDSQTIVVPIIKM